MPKYYVTVKYGTIWDFEMYLWEYKNGFYECVAYFYDISGIMTDEKCYETMVNIINEHLKDTDYSIETILIDPAAASFIKLCKDRGEFKVTKKYPYTDIDQI